MIKHLVCIIAFNIIGPMILQPLKISEGCGKFLKFSMVSQIDVELIVQAVQLRGWGRGGGVLMVKLPGFHFYPHLNG